MRRRCWTEKSHGHHMQTAPKDEHSQGSAEGECGQRETSTGTAAQSPVPARADLSSPRPHSEASAVQWGQNGDANLFLASYTHSSVGSSNLARRIQVVLTIGLILPKKSLHSTTGHFSHVKGVLLFFLCCFILEKTPFLCLFWVLVTTNNENSQLPAQAVTTHSKL